jgi:hypothetical protein
MIISIVVIALLLVGVFIWWTRTPLLPGIPHPPHHWYLGILPLVLKNKDRIHEWRQEMARPCIAKGQEMCQRATPG